MSQSVVWRLLQRGQVAGTLLPGQEHLCKRRSQPRHLSFSSLAFLHNQQRVKLSPILILRIQNFSTSTACERTTTESKSTGSRSGGYKDHRLETLGKFSYPHKFAPTLDIPTFHSQYQGVSSGEQGSKEERLCGMVVGVREAGKIEITSSDLNVELKDIHAELECLFPRRGKCCPRKYLKSCNTILAKTVRR